MATSGKQRACDDRSACAAAAVATAAAAVLLSLKVARVEVPVFPRLADTVSHDKRRHSSPMSLTSVSCVL